MEKIILKASERKTFGRKVKKLRREGVVPANIFGRKVKSVAVEVALKDLDKIYKEVGETGLFYLEVGKDSKPVLIHNVQRNPVNDSVVHVDFLQVDLTQKVSAPVPVEIVGEAPAEKQGLGVMVVQLDEVEVEALPTDLPEKFEVNVSNLEAVDQAIYVKDLKIDGSKVKVLSDAEEIVVKIEAQKEEKEEVVETPASEEATGEEAKEPGETTETPAEQETPKEE